jgi:hypothetical protein
LLLCSSYLSLGVPNELFLQAISLPACLAAALGRASAAMPAYSSARRARGFALRAPAPAPAASGLSFPKFRDIRPVSPAARRACPAAELLLPVLLRPTTASLARTPHHSVPRPCARRRIAVCRAHAPGAASQCATPLRQAPHDQSGARLTPRRHGGRQCRAGVHGVTQCTAAPQ